MNKNNYLIFGIILLGSLVLMTSYTAPAYNQINMTLCDGYTAPAYNQINFTLGDNDDCAIATCWSYTSATKTLYVPSNCTYYIPSGTTGYI